MVPNLGRPLLGQSPPCVRHALPALIPKPLPDRAVAEPQLLGQLPGSHKVIHASSVSGSRADNQNPTDHQSSNAPHVTHGWRRYAADSTAVPEWVAVAVTDRGPLLSDPETFAQEWADVISDQCP